jgi:thioredoxin reductase (NADPH)
MEAIGRDLREMQRIPLAPAHVEALRRVGKVVEYEQGATLAYPIQAIDRFIYIEDGEVEVVNSYTGERLMSATLGPEQFMAEIGLLSGGSWTLEFRAAKPCRVIEVPRQDMLGLMSMTPELSDIVITVITARRRRHLELRETSLVLLGEAVDRDVRRISDYAIRNKIPYVSLALGTPEADEAAASSGLSSLRPAVIFGRGVVVEQPSPAKIARLLGLSQDYPHDHDFDVLIIGGGPAGVAAAVYAGAEGLRALLVEDTAIGGQAGTSSRVENYMGFPTGISGSDLVWRGEIQALKFGTRFATPRRVVQLEVLENGHFRATFDDQGCIRSRAVVIATGVQYRRLPIERLQQFEGSGVYYAATESEARYCNNSSVVVIGGGNSAGQAAMYLRRIASRVHVVVRGGSLAASMSHYLSSRLAADPAISVDYHTEVVELHGSDKLEAVTLRDVATGAVTTVKTCALFVMVGAMPNTQWLSGLIDLDDKGFVLTGDAARGSSAYATSRPGIFAVGDVRAGSVKRVAASVGEGSVVISKVWEFLNVP